MSSFRTLILWLCLIVCSGIAETAFAQKTPAELARVYGEGESSPDVRLGKLRNLRDAYHPWTPPATLDEWKFESAKIRTQLKVSNGLVPEWPKTPLNAVIHGEIHRGDYIVQRVFFESLPGHFVTGNLYRPAKIEGKVPGVLSPHGHWADARFYDAGEQNALKAIEEGGEKYLSGGRHPIQARMVHLARMGCIVFHYDMVGYADSKVIDHRNDFADAEAGNWLINTMGLQTWNSIRALDFLTSLEEVDRDRLAVTGASGGGTQTFMLAALDDRIDVAFPAVMVSTAMQGGCVCENSDYLRQGINNVAMAAVFAPKPLAMTGANDWTIDIESKGLPELKQVYSLYDQPSNVYAEAHPEFGHNYNYVSRAIMYRWMAEHLDLPDAPLVETDFWPVPKEELSVFDEEHPLPERSKSAGELRAWMISQLTTYRQEMKELAAKDLDEYRRKLLPVQSVLFDFKLSMKNELPQFAVQSKEVTLNNELKMTKGTFSLKDSGIEIPYVLLEPTEKTKTVLWIDDSGKSNLFDGAGNIDPNIKRLLNAGYEIISIDPFLTGEASHPGWGNSILVDETYSGYTFGYNNPTIVQRIRDIATLLFVRDPEKTTVVGTGGAGVWTLLAASTVYANLGWKEMIVNLDGFTFADIEETSHPNYLPGAVRYGDIGGLGLLARPEKLIVGGVVEGSETAEMLKLGEPGRNGKLQFENQDFSRKEIVDRILNAK